MEVNWRLLILVVVLSILTIGRGDKTCNNDNCYATNGYVCNGQGSCDCGTCVCTPPFRGLTCEECPTCPTPCELFKGCVGCKIFGTGLVGIMECITQCDYMANYIPVDKDQFDLETGDSDLMLCKHTNEDYCVESFKIGGMSDGYRDLYVRTEMDCTPIEVPTLPPQKEVPAITSKFEPTFTSKYESTITSTLEPTTKRLTMSITTTSTYGQDLNTMQNTKTTSTVVQTDGQTNGVESSTETIISTHTSKTKDYSEETLIRVGPDQPADDSAPQNVKPVSGSDNPNSGYRSGSDRSVLFVFICLASCLRYVYIML